jgi:hypothetical protein
MKLWNESFKKQNNKVPQQHFQRRLSISINKIYFNPIINRKKISCSLSISSQLHHKYRIDSDYFIKINIHNTILYYYNNTQHQASTSTTFEMKNSKNLQT